MSQTQNQSQKPTDPALAEFWAEKGILRLTDQGRWLELRYYTSVPGHGFVPTRNAVRIPHASRAALSAALAPES